LYKIATSITEPLMIPISQFINTTFPEMTRSIVQRKWQELRTLLRRVTIISGVWTLLFTLGMLVLGPWVLSIWGQKYIAAYPTMMILLVGYGVSNIFYWNRTLLLSFGKANIPLYILFAGAVIKTALAFVVVPATGMAGEAWLLSGNFAITVGLMVAIGYSLIRKNERLDQQTAEAAA
jgi:O-antigen/teichoic acid export membrane protein